jgi:hypothetical protein
MATPDPVKFASFVKLDLPYSVEWNDLDAYSLKPAAQEVFAPFLRLSDGGLIALWYRTESPAVVHIGGHGESAFLAPDFDEFLRRAATRRTGLPDLDDEPALRVPKVKGEPSTDDETALREEFAAALEKHSALLPPKKSPETELLRQRVIEIATEMIRDGRSKFHTLASTWWSMDFEIARRGSELTITYLDYGQWYPVPIHYGLHDVVIELLKHVENNDRDRYELSAGCWGGVSIDRDRELILVPPDWEPPNC